MNITNAVYTDATNTTISADVDGSAVSIPVAAGNRHYNAIVDQSISIAAFVAPDVTLDQVRAARDSKMAVTDFTQLPDVLANSRLTAQEVADYATYRQALADITDGLSLTGVKSVDDVAWPTV
jgi:hypothetical protein